MMPPERQTCWWSRIAARCTSEPKTRRLLRVEIADQLATDRIIN